MALAGASRTLREPDASAVDELNRFVRRLCAPQPYYSVVRVAGPDHSPLFRAMLTWLPHRYHAEGIGSSKGAARRAGAAAMLTVMKRMAVLGFPESLTRGDEDGFGGEGEGGDSFVDERQLFYVDYEPDPVLKQGTGVVNVEEEEDAGEVEAGVVEDDGDVGGVLEGGEIRAAEVVKVHAADIHNSTAPDVSIPQAPDVITVRAPDAVKVSFALDAAMPEVMRTKTPDVVKASVAERRHGVDRAPPAIVPYPILQPLQGGAQSYGSSGSPPIVPRGMGSQAVSAVAKELDPPPPRPRIPIRSAIPLPIVSSPPPPLRSELSPLSTLGLSTAIDPRRPPNVLGSHDVHGRQWDVLSRAGEPESLFKGRALFGVRQAPAMQDDDTNTLARTDQQNQRVQPGIGAMQEIELQVPPDAIVASSVSEGFTADTLPASERRASKRIRSESPSEDGELSPLSEPAAKRICNNVHENGIGLPPTLSTDIDVFAGAEYMPPRKRSKLVGNIAHLVLWIFCDAADKVMLESLSMLAACGLDLHLCVHGYAHKAVAAPDLGKNVTMSVTRLSPVPKKSSASLPLALAFAAGTACERLQQQLRAEHAAGKPRDTLVPRIVILHGDPALHAVVAPGLVHIVSRANRLQGQVIDMIQSAVPS